MITLQFVGGPFDRETVNVSSEAFGQNKYIRVTLGDSGGLSHVYQSIVPTSGRAVVSLTYRGPV